jgi:hypothetical protein
MVFSPNADSAHVPKMKPQHHHRNQSPKVDRFRIPLHQRLLSILQPLQLLRRLTGNHGQHTGIAIAQNPVISAAASMSHPRLDILFLPCITPSPPLIPRRNHAAQITAS